MNPIKKFYDLNQFPGPYTINDLSAYGTPIENKYLSLIEKYIGPNQLVLDAGCGTGLISNLFALRHPSSQFVGVDFANSIDHADKFALTNNIKNIKFIKKDLLTYSTNKKFDVVICQGVLHHIVDYKTVLNNLLNLIAPGGRMILGLYHPGGKWLKKIMKLNYNSEILYKDQELNPMELSFTKKQLKELVPNWKIVSASPNFLGSLYIPAVFNSSNGGLIVYVLEAK
jgi:2-polyprenyl-3-methyl-5-hydroxy-6-metoxy-1,4-benzoquinol methylase